MARIRLCEQGRFKAYHSRTIRAKVCRGKRKPTARFVKRNGRPNYYVDAVRLNKYGVPRGQRKSRWEKDKDKKALKRAKSLTAYQKRRATILRKKQRAAMRRLVQVGQQVP